MDYGFSSSLIVILAVVTLLGKGQDYQTQEIPLESNYVYHTFQEVIENQDSLTGDGPIEDHAYQTDVDYQPADGIFKSQDYYPTEGTIGGHDYLPGDGIIEGYSYQAYIESTEGHDQQTVSSVLKDHEYQTVEGNTENYVNQPAEDIIADYQRILDTKVDYNWIPDVSVGLDYQVDVDPNQEFEEELRKQGLIEDSDVQATEDYVEGHTKKIFIPISNEMFIPASLFSAIDPANEFATTLSTPPTVDDGYEDERIRDYRNRVRNYLKQLSEENGRIIDVGKRPENTKTGEEMLTSDTTKGSKEEHKKLGDTLHKAKKSPKSTVGQIGSFMFAVGDNTRNILLHMFEKFISVFYQET